MSYLEKENFSVRAEEIGFILKEIEAFEEIDSVCLDRFLQRCSHSRIVLLGESTHGTSEFYRMRAKITQQLVKRCGFTHVAIEAGWSEVEAIDRTVRNAPLKNKSFTKMTRFGSWMWNNAEFSQFLDWMKNHNVSVAENHQVGIYGLDLYGMGSSIDVILEHLQKFCPSVAAYVQKQYSGLFPWKENPTEYGRAVYEGRCQPVFEQLKAALQTVLQEQVGSEEEYFHLICNMKMVIAAEEYFRKIYKPTSAHWNVRERYLFETLNTLVTGEIESGIFWERKKTPKIVVWAHNSHVGHAKVSSLMTGGLLSLGQLCKEKYQEGDVYAVGFGFYQGEITAAPYWGEPEQSIDVGISPEGGIETLLHETGARACLLPLRLQDAPIARQIFLPSRLERGIGLCYDLSTGYQASFYPVCLAERFDEFVWFDKTGSLSLLV
jgi:erythromycin esterase-like protein